MREKIIEKVLVRQVQNAGGIAPKFVSPGTDGMPDRIVLLPHGRMAFVELKAPGQKPRPLQESRHRLLRTLGYDVYVIDHIAAIPDVIEKIKGGGQDEV